MSWLGRIGALKSSDILKRIGCEVFDLEKDEFDKSIKFAEMYENNNIVRKPEYDNDGMVYFIISCFGSSTAPYRYYPSMTEREIIFQPPSKVTEIKKEHDTPVTTERIDRAREVISKVERLEDHRPKEKKFGDNVLTDIVVAIKKNRA